MGKLGVLGNKNSDSEKIDWFRRPMGWKQKQELFYQ